MYLPDCGACMMSAQYVGGYLVTEGAEDMTHGELVYDPNAVFGRSEGESTCDWVNEDCPEQCKTEHDEPEPDYDGFWSCPDTGTKYRFCEHCGWDVHSRWGTYPTEVNGEWLCDPYSHGYTSCDHCGEYVDEDTTQYVEGTYDDAYVCEDCYRTHMEEERRRSLPTPPRQCRICNTAETFLDVLTERFVCKCGADRLKAARKPVLTTVAA